MTPKKRSLAHGAMPSPYARDPVEDLSTPVSVPISVNGSVVRKAGKRAAARKSLSAPQQRDVILEAGEDREPSPGYPSSQSSDSSFLGETKTSKRARQKSTKDKTTLEVDAVTDFPPRPPPLNSTEMPLPWKGRLGYACLNTVLRARRDPIFCSRTCRLDSINKLGLQFAKDLGRQNAADLSGMIRWNETFGIKFLRISSEMFPFASHAEHGYDLAHADAELRAAGALATQYGHRLTVHPGQFTQIASPRPEVFTAAVRDLEMHEELLTRLRLEGQADRDAIMVIHLGGGYGDKTATIGRFRTNYLRLSERVRRRLVLENDDVTWSVEDLLPLCEELNIPLVLDWHHNNIVPGSLREGTFDVRTQYIERITKTWSRKQITPKQHYSEPREPNNPSPHKRRAHSRRVQSLPPCAPDMDLMIEAKDKEQAVFELSRILNLDRPPLPREVVAEGDRDGEAYYPEGEEARLKPPHLRILKQREKELIKVSEAAEAPAASQEPQAVRRRRKKVQPDRPQSHEDIGPAGLPDDSACRTAKESLQTDLPASDMMKTSVEDVNERKHTAKQRKSSRMKTNPH